MYAHRAEHGNVILCTLANCFIPITYIKAYIVPAKCISIFCVWDVSIISLEDKLSAAGHTGWFVPHIFGKTILS